jgi:Domain of unknown function (DUF1707)
VVRAPWRRDRAAGGRLIAVVDQVRHPTRDRRLLAAAIAWAAANWLLDAATRWACVRACGAAPGADGTVVAHGIAAVVAALPITPGGLRCSRGARSPFCSRSRWVRELRGAPATTPYSVRSTWLQPKHCVGTIPSPPTLPTVDDVDMKAAERSTMMTTTTDEAPRLRASDAERTETVDVLQGAMARGMLTHEEGDERMAAAFSARFRDQLPPLIADLSPAETAAQATTPPVGWRGLFAALVTLVRAEIAATAAAGFRSRRFLVIVLVVLALLGGLALVVGHGLVDGDHGHLVRHGER